MTRQLLLAMLPVYMLFIGGCAKPQYTAPDVAVASQPAVVPTSADDRNQRLTELARASAGRQSTQEQQIGPDDLLQVTVFAAPEMSGSVRVSAQGDISLPLIGTVRAAGSTPEQVARAVEQQLRAKYMRDPHVSVEITEAQSQPVSVLGAVKQPGVVRIRSTRSLLEVLALAGGLGEDAGEQILVTRASSAPGTTTKSASAIEIRLGDLLASPDARHNIPVHPGDVVTVQRAGMIYVVGEVNKPGAFALVNGAPLTVVQAVALGQGLRPNASRGKVIVVRTDAAGERISIPVDIGRALSGRGTDVRLQSNDIVFVPSSATRAFTFGAIDAMVRAVSRGVF